MATAMKQNSATASHECDMNAMEPLVGKYQMDLEATKPKDKRGTKDSLSNKSMSMPGSEVAKSAKVGRSRSTFAYILIVAGMLICLVWSATLLCFLVRGLLRVIF